MMVATGGVIGCAIIVLDAFRARKTYFKEEAGEGQATAVEGDQQRSETQLQPMIGRIPGKSSAPDSELDHAPQQLHPLAAAPQLPHHRAALREHSRAISRALGGTDDVMTSAEAIGYDKARASAIEGAERGEDPKWSMHKTLRYGLDVAVLGAIASAVVYLLASETNVSGWLWLEQNYPAEFGTLSQGRIRFAQAWASLPAARTALWYVISDTLWHARRWLHEHVGVEL